MIPNMDSITIGGISALVLIPLIIAFARGMGMEERATPLLAVIVGIAATVTAELAREYEEVAKWSAIVVIGFVLGLAAIGWTATKDKYQEQAESKDAEKRAAEKRAALDEGKG